MLFSHVKISSFRAKAHLVFHWCLYNKDCLSTYYTFIYLLLKNKFVFNKLQIGPSETFQKIKIWESELISKG